VTGNEWAEFYLEVNGILSPTNPCLAGYVPVFGFWQVHTESEDIV